MDQSAILGATLFRQCKSDLGVTMETTAPRYSDYYWSLSLKDFTECVANGTLESYTISEREQHV